MTVRYAKAGNMRFISHLDLMRTITRSILRADIKIKYSEGFSPHALIFLSPPMPIGIASRAEYITLETNGSAKGFVERFNRAAPAGLTALAAFETSKNPRLAAKIIEADYSFFVRASAKKMEIEKIADCFTLTLPKKDETVFLDTAGKIKKVEVLSDRISVRLAAGNAPLRADRLAENLNREFNLDIKIPEIIKEEQYVYEEGLRPVDAYLEGLL